MPRWNSKKTKSLGVCAAIIAWALPLIVAPAARADQQSLEAGLSATILSLEKTRKAVAEHYSAAAGTAAPGYSRDEALLFVAYLEGRIQHYCKELALSGGPHRLDGLPCRAAGQRPAGDPRFEVVPDSAGQTSAEKVADLDKELGTALGAFDDMLLQEQDKVAAHSPRQREGGSGGQGGQTSQGDGSGNTGGGSPEGQGQGPGSGAGGDESRRTGAGPDQGTANEGAGQGRAGSPRTPPTQGSRELSESDDDIVARQLREAAEQEKDPEVKEKLWEEYRKYKEGIK